MENLNLATKLYHQIKQDIIETKIAPGEYIQERNLAELYSSSRTPVREALKRLNQEGWLEGGERRRHRVRPLSLKFGQDIFEAREMIEIKCLERVFEDNKSKILAGKLNNVVKEMEQIQDNAFEFICVDISFHTEIVLEAQNEILIKMWSNLSEHIARLAIFSWDEQRPSSHIIQEHYSVVNALWNENLEEVKQTLLAHYRMIQDGLERTRVKDI